MVRLDPAAIKFKEQAASFSNNLILPSYKKETCSMRTYIDSWYYSESVPKKEWMNLYICEFCEELKQTLKFNVLKTKSNYLFKC